MNRTNTRLIVCLLPFLFVVALHASPDREPDSLKVFLLAGQSNMEGQAVVDLDHPDHYNGGRGILSNVLEDPETEERFGHWRDDEGEWVVRPDVFVHYQPERGPLKSGPLSIGFAGYGGAHHFGPELEIGRVLGDHFDEPVLLVKACWGGKSLMTDFRPPSAGGEVGPCYQRMIEACRDAIADIDERFPRLSGLRVDFAGLIWFQGWNDQYEDGALEAYAGNLAALVRDVRSELDAPELPFVVGQTGNADNPRLWAAQKSATDRKEFDGEARYVVTRDFLRRPEDSPNTGHGHHWFGNAESYLLIGEALGDAMISLMPRE